MTAITFRNSAFQEVTITVKPTTKVEMHWDYDPRTSTTWAHMVVDGKQHTIGLIDHVEPVRGAREAAIATFEAVRDAVRALHQPATFQKLVAYDRVTKDFALYLDNEFIGYSATITEGHARLDAIAYERLRRGAVAR